MVSELLRKEVLHGMQPAPLPRTAQCLYPLKWLSTFLFKPQPPTRGAVVYTITSAALLFIIQTQ